MKQIAIDKKQHIFDCRVYYEDTDAAGIVYYANYLKFIERARTECLRNLGISQSIIKEKFDLIFVVKKIYADYFKPAKLDDCLEIRTTFLKIGRVSLQLDQEVRVGAEIMFRAQVKLGVLNSIRNPSQLPTRIMDKIRQLGK